MSQLAMPLEDPRAAVGHVGHADPDTSRQAAQRPRKGLMALVVAALAAHPAGLTDHELLIATGLPEHKRGSVVRRRADAGAYDTGRRRSSPDGNPMVVWSTEVRS